MKQNLDAGYRMPAELVKVMDLASELNAKLNECAKLENKHLVQSGWCSDDEVGDFTFFLRHATDRMSDVMNNLADYASERIKCELFDKYQ